PRPRGRVSRDRHGPDRRHGRCPVPDRRACGHDRAAQRRVVIRRLRAAARLVIVWLRAAPSGIAILVAIVALTSFLATAAPLWFDRSSQAGLAALLTTAPRGGSGLEFERSGQIEPGTGDP